MIDQRFSRDAFEACRSAVDRRALGRELAREIRAAILEIPTADGAVSSILGRLRLVGHHLYPGGEGVFAGDPSADAASPTGLVVRFGPEGVDVEYVIR